VLDLETSGDDVPPLVSNWELMMPGNAPPPEPPPTTGEGLELAAPWEFVGYQGDAAGDLQKPAAVAELPPPLDSERPPDEETAAQIAAAVANDELDWNSVIAFDGEKSTEPEQQPAPPPAPVPATDRARAMETAMNAVKGATHAATISEALLAYCQQGFGRAFLFVVQYGVAML